MSYLFISPLLWTLDLYSPWWRFIHSNVFFVCFPLPFISHPAHLSSRLSDTGETGCRDCSKTVKKVAQEAGEIQLLLWMRQKGWRKAVTLSLLGQVTRVTGLSCMSEAPVFNHRGARLLLFPPSPHRLSQMNWPICQLPVQPAAESANKWASKDLPAGPSVITKVTLWDMWGSSLNPLYMLATVWRLTVKNYLNMRQTVQDVTYLLWCAALICCNAFNDHLKWLHEFVKSPNVKYNGNEK